MCCIFLIFKKKKEEKRNSKLTNEKDIILLSRVFREQVIQFQQQSIISNAILCK